MEFTKLTVGPDSGAVAPGPGVVTTPGPDASVPGCWSRVWGHYLASHMLKLPHHF